MQKEGTTGSRIPRPADEFFISAEIIPAIKNTSEPQICQQSEFHTKNR